MALILTPATESRILAEATRRNQPPEAVINAALEALWQKEPVAVPSAEDEQQRMRDLLTSVQAQARLLPPIPAEERTTGSAPEEQSFGEIVAEKYRKQGFNL